MEGVNVTTAQPTRHCKVDSESTFPQTHIDQYHIHTQLPRQRGHNYLPKSALVLCVLRVNILLAESSISHYSISPPE